MIYEKKICGKYVYLSSADIDDAEFTLSLRKSPELTRYMPTLNITVVQQRAWIESQRNKENDYFFVVRTILNQPIGTVSLYNMQGKTGESGRLVLVGNALENTEASLLLFRFGFTHLQLEQITGYVYADNKRATRFNSLFGCVTGEPEQHTNGQMIRRTLITSDSFARAEQHLVRILYPEKTRSKCVF